MDVLKGYVSAVAKSQTRFGLLLFISTLVCSILLTTEMYAWYSKDKRAFRCTPHVDKTADARCYQQYVRENHSQFSQMSFALVNGFTVVGLWVVYAIYITPNVRNYIRRNELQLRQEPAPSLLRSYEIHIVVRMLFLGVMIGLLLTVQKFQLPDSFECSPEGMATNLTKLRCTDGYSSEKSKGNIAMLAFNGALLIFSAIEGLYLPIKIQFRARAEHRSLNETFFSYLMDETAEDCPAFMLDAYFWNLRQDVLAFTERQRVLFPSYGQDTIRIDDIYTDVVIQQGRAECKLNARLGRQHNLRIYAAATDIPMSSVRDIFKPPENTTSTPKVILVSGGAGLGKSFFCHKLLREWAKGDRLSRNAAENYGSFNFVSILKFREVNHLKANALTLFDLLRASVLSSGLDRSVYRYILRHPSQLLVLFDGLDEFNYYRNCTDDEQGYINDVNEKMPVSALYGKILKGKFLKGATIVTTSRPAALDFVGDIEFDRVVEILGFAPKQVREYIERFCGSDRAMREAIIRHVFDNENIVSFCYLPVNCMLICSYLEYTLSEGLVRDTPVLPTTLTDMYEGVLRMFAARHDHSSQDREVEGTSVDSKQTFEKLCSLAMEGIKLMKLTFLRSDLITHGLSDHDIQALLDSGLLHCLPPVRSGPLDVDAQYCFIHLTIQEFLAAKRLGTLPEDSIGTSVMLGAHWDLVVQFFCGLKDTSPAVVQSVLCRLLRLSSDVSQWDDQVDNFSVEVQIDVGNSEVVSTTSTLYHSSVAMGDSPSPEGDIVRNSLTFSRWHEIETIQIRSKCEMQLFAVKCLHETQSRELVGQVGRKCFPCKIIDLSGLDMSPGDCPAIQYFLIESGETLERLLLQNNNIGASGCRALSRAIALGAGPKEMLDISNTSIGDEGASYLFQALEISGQIPPSMYLTQNGITAAGAQTIVEVMQRYPQVQDLDVGYNELGTDGAGVISTLLCSRSCEITRLGIAGNAFGNAGVARVCSSLMSGTFTLVELDLRTNGIDSTGCLALANLLTSPHCCIQTVALSGNPICSPSITGFQRLAMCLKEGVSQVRNLLLHDCGISVNAVLFLSAALRNQHCSVRSIDLSYNNIGDDGCKFLSLVGLSHSPVEDINLDRNEINDEGAAWLLRALQSPQCNLRNLSLGDNNISQGLEVELLNAWGENRRGGLHLI